MEARPSDLSSRLPRLAVGANPGSPTARPQPTSTCAAFSRERRMRFANAIKLDKRSGGRRGISCLAAPKIPTCAAFLKEGRMAFASAKKFNRKYGVAQWRDLRWAPTFRGDDFRRGARRPEPTTGHETSAGQLLRVVWRTSGGVNLYAGRAIEPGVSGRQPASLHRGHRPEIWFGTARLAGQSKSSNIRQYHCPYRWLSLVKTSKMKTTSFARSGHCSA
jgi:hypothetical protein